MSARVYVCGCGKEWCWTSGTQYHDVILAAQAFLFHRWSHTCDGTAIPRRTDEQHALCDIEWAAGEIAKESVVRT